MNQILFMSFIAGLAIGIGGLLVFIIDNFNHRVLASILGFSAGMMLLIALFEILPSSLAKGNFNLTLLGLGVGFILIFLIDAGVPHHCFHRFHNEKESILTRDNQLIKVGLLIGLGVVLHNLVEGLVVGAGHFAERDSGFFIALALAIHNLPIGIAIATPLKLGKLSNFKIILTTILIGLFTPLGTIISLYLHQISGSFISFSLALSGGIMLNIIIRELIPESYKYHKGFASLGLILGIIFVQLLQH